MVFVLVAQFILLVLVYPQKNAQKIEEKYSNDITTGVGTEQP